MRLADVLCLSREGVIVCHWQMFCLSREGLIVRDWQIYDVQCLSSNFLGVSSGQVLLTLKQNSWHTLWFSR